MKLAKFLLTLTLVSAAANCTAATATVVDVRPSGAAVPENLLRLSIVFASQPLQPVIPRLRLLHDDGTAVYRPFDSQELWSPDGRILTVMLHPGRVKTGLVAHDTLGRALTAGEHVRLVLGSQQIASWNVTASNEMPPNPSRWKIISPRAGTRGQLIIMLNAPIDAMDRDLIAIAGPDKRRVPGHAALSRGETRWFFCPVEPWRAGIYSVVASGELEDGSGNRVGLRFEHGTDVSEPQSDSSVAFRIQ